MLKCMVKVGLLFETKTWKILIFSVIRSIRFSFFKLQLWLLFVNLQVSLSSAYFRATGFFGVPNKTERADVKPLIVSSEVISLNVYFPDAAWGKIDFCYLSK